MNHGGVAIWPCWRDRSLAARSRSSARRGFGAHVIRRRRNAGVLHYALFKAVEDHVLRTERIVTRLIGPPVDASIPPWHIRQALPGKQL